MQVSDFHFDLPEELIAQQPLADRAASRLLHLKRTTGNFADRQFRDFPQLLAPGDLVVFNNTRVFPARLYGLRGGAKSQPVRPHNPAARDFLQGRIEVLLTKQLSRDPNEWECLVRPGRKIGVGERLFFGQSNPAGEEHPRSNQPRGCELEAEVIARGPFGERHLRFAPTANFFAAVEKIGHIPLPPYIARADSTADRERYQTVYANESGSVAAPTAGLHFTPEILSAIKSRGVEIAEITLHVGLGTFQPIRVGRVEDHKLHTERYSITPEAASRINRAKTNSRRIVAVGTTTVRTLEHAMLGTREIPAGSGDAGLFIYPGHTFRLVDALLTNFHLPQSSLLMLVCALGGTDTVLRAYTHAVAERYRFYSYGDCMFLE